jgi:hypothetical protein
MKGYSYNPAPSLCIHENFCSTLWGSARNHGIIKKKHETLQKIPNILRIIVGNFVRPLAILE